MGKTPAAEEVIEAGRVETEEAAEGLVRDFARRGRLELLDEALDHRSSWVGLQDSS
jgi:hypothetical protein